MARETFIIKLEWEEAFQDLTNEELGILFMNFYNYWNGKEVDLSNRSVSLVWKIIINDIKRIEQNYNKNTENGKKGGRPKKTQNNPTITQNNPTITQNNPTITEPKPKDKDKDIDIDKDIDKVKNNEVGNIITNNTGRNLVIDCDYTWKEIDYKNAWEQGKKVMFNDIEITADNIDDVLLTSVFK